MPIASTQIREMFEGLAPGYDRANQVLSLGIHHRWRRALVRRTGVTPGMRVLDCATGTGDLALEFKRAVGPTGHVVGIDFAPRMVSLAVQKSERRKLSVEFWVGDVLRLPFPDRSFDAASIAFGIRNVDDPIAGLREMARVVKPGGSVAVLEFGQPDNALFRRLYHWYSGHVIPTIGGLVTGDRRSYHYLTDSAAAFPAGERFIELMRETEVFSAVAAAPLTFKIAYTYVGRVREAI